MSSGTGIEWTDTTWNPVVGCTPVSPGCLNCYAATMARRLEAMGQKDYQPREEPLTAKELREAHAAVGGGKLHDHERVKEIRIAEVKNGRAVFTGEVRCLPDRLTVGGPLRWKKPRMVFVNSMSDLFHEAVPFDFIDKVFAVMAMCPRHTFQILTKRPERMAEYMTRREISKAWTPSVRAGDGGSDSAKWKTPCDSVYMIARQMKGLDAAPELIWPLPNVWLGTSVEDQTRADERIPHLLRCPAAVRFLSCEPLLGAVDFGLTCKRTGIVSLHKQMHWVIVGGESGAKSRPCDVANIRSIVRQCRDSGVPCFVKQLGANCGDTPAGGEWIKGRFNKSADECGYTGVRRLNDRKGGDMAEWPEDLRIRELPTSDIPHPTSGAKR